MTQSTEVEHLCVSLDVNSYLCSRAVWEESSQYNWYRLLSFSLSDCGYVKGFLSPLLSATVLELSRQKDDNVCVTERKALIWSL